MADVISHQSDAASNIQWDTIQSAAIVVRCTARLGARPVTIQSVHSSTIVESHGHRLHQYADDCQVYVSVPVTEAAAAVDRFSRCVADVSMWLSSSRLRLNPAKTVVIWLGVDSPGVCVNTPGLLQQSHVRYCGWTDATASSSPERRHTSDHRRLTARPHIACSLAAALASSPPTS